MQGNWRPDLVACRPIGVQKQGWCESSHSHGEEGEGDADHGDDACPVEQTAASEGNRKLDDLPEATTQVRALHGENGREYLAIK